MIILGLNGRAYSELTMGMKRQVEVRFMRIYFTNKALFFQVKVRFGADPRQFCIMTQEFLDDGNGHVSGVKTVTVEWQKDEAGRWQMKPIPGSEQTFKADLVLLAMGFLGPERAVASELELKLDARSNFETKEYQTSISNVFAAGGNLIVTMSTDTILLFDYFRYRLPTRSIFSSVGHRRGAAGRSSRGRISEQG